MRPAIGIALGALTSALPKYCMGFVLWHRACLAACSPGRGGRGYVMLEKEGLEEERRERR